MYIQLHSASTGRHIAAITIALTVTVLNILSGTVPRVHKEKVGRIALVALLWFATAIAGVASSPAAAAATLSFEPLGDTFVTSAKPNGNFSTSDRLRANGTPRKIALLRFDPNGFPEDAGATAKLVLRGMNVTQPSQIVTLHPVTGTWNPATVTYNTRPTLGIAIATATLSQNGTAEFTLPFSMPNSVRDYAITATSTTTSSDARIASTQQTDPALRPRIVVTYPDTEPAYGATGSGTAKTDDCTTTVPAGGAPQTAIDNAAIGAVVCITAANYSTDTLTVNKAVTVRATGEVKIKNAIVGGGATFEGFTVVGGAAGNPSTGILFSGNDNLIRNNLINGHGLQRGIYCTSCGTGSILDHNTITKINNYGIQVGSSGNGITISRNNIYDLYDTVNNGLDVDGMRIFGTNHVVRENYLHDMYVGNSVSRPHLDCFQNYQGTNLVAQNITYEDNYCMRVSGMFIITANNQSSTRTMSGYTIRGNVAEVYGWQVVILSGIDGATVENNTFFGATKGGSNITVEHNPDSGAQSSAIRVQNNVLVRGYSTNAAVGDRSGNPTPAGTTVNRDNVTCVDSALAAADINHETNPVHVTTPIIASDFTGYRTRSQSCGTLLDQGTAMLTPGLTVDASGNPRVQGPAVDIGAYEEGKSPTASATSRNRLAWVTGNGE